MSTGHVRDTSLKSSYRAVTAIVHQEQLLRFQTVEAQGGKMTMLIGDSIIERLDWFAHKIMPKDTVILAKGGDKIEHLLWRVENTPDSSLVTKIVLHIGTNNLKSFSDTQKEVAQTSQIAINIGSICALLQEKYKNATIYLLPLYNRADIDALTIQRLNANLAGLASNRVVVVSDFWKGVLSDSYDVNEFSDHVHMSLASYDRFYTKLQQLLQQS